MFLREYLYVDIDKVRGILSQIAEGVPENRLQKSNEKRKAAEVRISVLGGLGQKELIESILTEKNLGDSLFIAQERGCETLTPAHEALASTTQYEKDDDERG